MTAGIVLVEMAGRALTGEQVRLFGLGPAGRVLGLATIGALTGLCAGLAQRFALRRSGAEARGWIGRCTIAFGLGLPGGSLAADLLLGGLQSATGFVLFLGVGGLIVGAVTAGSARRFALALS